MSIGTGVRMITALALLQPLTALPTTAGALATSVPGTQTAPACASASTAAAPVPCAKAASNATDRHPATEAYGQLPLAFEANAGQYDDAVRFVARGGGYALWLTADEAVLALHPPRGGATADDRPAPEAQTLRMRVLGGNQEPDISGEESLPGVVNHFVGSDPARWRTRVPTFGKVRYGAVYPGIDLEYYGNQRRLEYDFVVQPGADPSVIALAFPGAETARVAPDGGLVLGVAGREVRWHAPVMYQPAGDKRLAVAGAYRLLTADASDSLAAPAIGFSVSDYDRSAPLVIDPILSYATFLGGLADDHAFSVAVDQQGRAHVTGFTYSADFPVADAEQAVLAGAQDVFVTKLNATGTDVIYSTYLGGSAYEVGRGIALDGNRNAYITGDTSSSDFPVTPGAYETVHGGNEDVFVAKLDKDGVLDYATYVGDTGNEQGEDIAVQAGGRAYVTGWTESTLFPTTAGAYNQTYSGGPFDAFVFRLNTSGSGLSYSTFLGGSDYDHAYGIALSGNEAYVTGYTASTDFPVVGGYDATHDGATDAFVSHLSGDGATLLDSTFLGGDGGEVGEDLTLGAAGHVFVTGWTSSTGFPTTAGAYDTSYNGGVDGFVTKLNGGLANLTYSTFIGGTGYDTGRGIAVNSFGGAVVTGSTGSSDFPTVNPIQAAFAGGTLDAFVLRVVPTGASLNFSTYLGGPGYDLGYEIGLDGCGLPYTVGKADDGFPSTVGAFDETWNGDGDGFVVKIQSN